MRILVRIRSWLQSILHRSRAERRMDAEFDAHLDAYAQDLVGKGLSAEEARRKARLEFGGIENTKEECRDVGGANFAESLSQDVRFGLRMLRKSPGFATVAILTLALGIGANTAVFSVVNAVILRPLPFKDSQRMYAVSLHTPMFPSFSLGLPWPAFQAIQSGVPALQESSVYKTKQLTFTGDGNPAEIEISEVSGGYFPEFGAQPQIGRLFSDGDFRSGENRVLVLSDKFWRTRFGSDPGVLGKELILDKESWRVIGVAARGFDYPGQQAWTPLVLSDEDKVNQTFFALQFIGKLRPGQSVDQLKAQLNAVAGRLVAENPDLGDGYAFEARNLLESEIANVRSVYFVLFGAATLVLLIACANLASLLLSRGAGRRREMAMRAALGASRSRLLRQGLVESCLLAFLGGALGVLLAAGGVQLFRSIAPENTPRLAEISVDASLFWFSFLTALLAGILFGIAPARRASRLYPNEALKDGGGAGVGGARSASQMRLGKTLVVVEVALAFILLVGSALTVQTVTKLLHQETGFRTDHLLTFDLPQVGVDLDTEPTEKRIAEDRERLERVFAQIARIPGVLGVTAASHGVLGGTSMMMSGFQVQGALPERPGAERHAIARYVDPSYFATLVIPIVRGRDFTPRIGEKTPSEIIVNEAMAKEYWGTLDVIGKHATCSRTSDGKPVWGDVVGVVANARETSISLPPQPAYYLSMLQTSNGHQHVFVRTQNDPVALAATITKQLWAMFPDQPVSGVSTITQVIAKSVGSQRLRSILLTLFALVGFTLALVGTYGVISFSVSRRVQEIGVRIAVGARSADVLRMILLQGLLLVTLGIAIGAAAASGLSRLIANQLYGVQPGDPLAFLGAGALVFLVSAIACLLPACRAVKVDPIIVLRYE